MLEFRKYPGEPPEGTEPPACVVTYPEPCGRAAAGEVWCLPFCEAHGKEAAAAAYLEAFEDAKGSCTASSVIWATRARPATPS